MLIRIVRALAVSGVFALALPCAAAAADGQPIPAATASPAPPAVEAARQKSIAGDTTGAIEVLAPFFDSNPSDVAAGRLLGDLYYRVPNLKLAEATYKRILKIAPDDRDTHNRLGGIYSAQDRIPEAIAEFEKSLPVREGFIGLVELHRRNGDLVTFERDVAQRAENDRFDPNAQSNYGNVLRAEHRFIEAIVYFKRELSLRPSSCYSLNDLANAYLDVARVMEAVPLLDKCLGGEPGFYPALVNIGEANIEIEKYDKAREYLQKALTIRRDGPEALVDLGYIADVRQQWRAAIQYYQQAISADPLARDAYVDLGYDYNEHQLYPLAEAAFLKGLSVSPGDGRLHYMLAVTYNVQGKLTLARAQYQNALACDEPLVVRAATAELALLPRGN